MNIIAGCMIPLTNCALKLALYSSSLCSSNAAADSSCRPKTFTSECPVYISSMCALSLPVEAHCFTNCGCARLPSRLATSSDSGTVTSATRASSGEIQNIITSTPTMVSRELMIWPMVCWSVCPMLSMSLVARLRTSPRVCLSKYDSGSRDSFASTCSRSRKTVWLIARTDSRPLKSISRPARAYTRSASSSS